MKKLIVYIFFILLAYISYSNYSSIQINDIDIDSKFYNIIIKTVEKGIFDLDDLGDFYPKEIVTRKALAETICRLKSLPLTNCIETAENENYLSVFTDRNPSPEKEITRAQLIATMVRVEELDLIDETETGYIDVPHSHWAATAIATAIDNNLIPPGNGQGESLGIDAPATKISLAILVYRTNSFKNVNPAKLAERKEQTKYSIKIKKLEEEKAGLLKQISNLKETIKKFQAKESSLTEKVKLYMRSTNLSQKSEKILLNKNKYLNTENKDLINKNEKLEEENNFLKNKTAVLEEKVRTIEESKASIYKKIKDYYQEKIVLESKLGKITSENISFKSKNDDLEKINLGLSEQIRDLYNNKTKRLKELSKKDKKYASLLKKKNYLVSKNITLEKEKDIITKQLKTLSNNVTSLQEELATIDNKYKNYVQELRDKLETAHVQKNQLLLRKNDLIKELEALKAKANEVDKRHKITAEILASAKKEQVALQKKLHNEIITKDKKIKNLENNLSSLEKERNNIASENKSISKAYNTVSFLNSKLKKKNKILAAKLKEQIELTDKIQLLTSENASLISLKQQQQAEIKKLKIKTKKYKTNSMALYKRKGSLVSENKTLQSEIAKNTKLLKATKEKEQEMAKQIQAYKETIAGLKKTLAKCNDIKFRAKKLQETNKNLLSEKSSIVSKNNNLEKQIKELTKELKIAKQTNQQLFKRKQELIKQNTSLKENKPTNNETKKLKTQLKKTQKANRQLLKNKQNLSEEIASLNIYVVNLQQEIQELSKTSKSKISKDKNNLILNNKTKELKKQLQIAKETNKQLLKRKQELLAQNTSLNASITNLKQINNETKKSNKQLLERKQELLAQIKKLQNDTNKKAVANNNIENNTKSEKLIKDKKQLEKQLQTIKNDNESLKQDNQSLTSEIAILKEQIKKYKNNTNLAIKSLTKNTTIEPQKATNNSIKKDEEKLNQEFNALKNKLKITFSPQPVLQEEPLSIKLEKIPSELISTIEAISIKIIDTIIVLEHTGAGIYKGEFVIPANLEGGKKKAYINVFNKNGKSFSIEKDFEVMQWWDG